MPISHARLRALAAGVAAMCVVTAASAADGNSAELVAQKIPVAADMGTIVAANITVKNVGTDAWTAERKAALEIKEAGADKNWGVSRVELDPTEVVQPGDSKTFRFDLKIPETPGNYLFAWSMMLDGQVLPTHGASASPIRVDDPVARSGFVSQLMPDRVSPGERFKTLVQFRNDGRASWSRAKGVRLAVSDAATAKAWGLQSVELENDDVVLPGNVATFAFHMIAPTKPGTYDLAWRMFQDGRQFFGESAPPAAISVGNSARATAVGTFSAEFVGQTIPHTVQPNQTFRVVVVFKNTGSQAWVTGNVVLAAQPPANNLLWLVDEIELAGARAVTPGDIKAFEFTVRAPAEPGIYPFIWRLYHVGSGGFGDRSEMRQINVAK